MHGQSEAETQISQLHSYLPEPGRKGLWVTSCSGLSWPGDTLSEQQFISGFREGKTNSINAPQQDTKPHEKSHQQITIITIFAPALALPPPTLCPLLWLQQGCPPGFPVQPAPGRWGPWSLQEEASWLSPRFGSSSKPVLFQNSSLSHFLFIQPLLLAFMLYFGAFIYETIIATPAPSTTTQFIL